MKAKEIIICLAIMLAAGIALGLTIRGEVDKAQASEEKGPPTPLHEWEVVGEYDPNGLRLMRCPVPGGWIYKSPAGSIAFVPK